MNKLERQQLNKKKSRDNNLWIGFTTYKQLNPRNDTKKAKLLSYSMKEQKKELTWESQI